MGVRRLRIRLLHFEVGGLTLEVDAVVRPLGCARDLLLEAEGEPDRGEVGLEGLLTLRLVDGLLFHARRVSRRPPGRGRRTLDKEDYRGCFGPVAGRVWDPFRV